jgi:hypothetical protein
LRYFFDFDLTFFRFIGDFSRLWGSSSQLKPFFSFSWLFLPLFGFLIFTTTVVSPGPGLLLAAIFVPSRSPNIPDSKLLLGLISFKKLFVSSNFSQFFGDNESAKGLAERI